MKELSEISGVHRNTISNGVSEINEEGFETRYTVFADATGNVRTGNQGRKSIKEKYPQIEDAIEAIVGKETYGTV